MPSILWSSEEIKKRINLYLFMDKNKGIPSLMDKLMDKLEIHSKHKSRMTLLNEKKPKSKKGLSHTEAASFITKKDK